MTRPRRLYLWIVLAGCAAPLAAQEALPPIVDGFAPPPLAQPAPNGAPAAPPGPAVSGRVFTPAETLAVVGDQHILAGDLLGDINQMLAPYVGKAPDDELQAQRELLLKQMLPAAVENKLLYLEFRRQIPADKVPEIEKRVGAEFDEEKLETAMERAKVSSPRELDALLRKYGSSLEKQRRAFTEQKLGRAMLSKEIDYKPEITHEEMLAYYRDHAAEFDVAAKARWEQFSVLFSNHPDKENAWSKIAGMGNEVLRGAAFAAVAKKHSEGTSAADGGQYDWVTRGSLASTALDEAIFTLPPNRLSQIIEDDRGFHIIRVLERTDAGRIEFVTAQEEIKEKLKKQKVQEQVAAYVNRLKTKTRVWTVFDEETAKAAPATTAQEDDTDTFIPR